MFSRIRALPGVPQRAELVGLVPALGVLVVWIVLMQDYGGYFPRHWLPAGLVLAGLLVVALIVRGRALPAAAPVRHALLAFAVFVGWNFLSILWSDAPGKALDASNLLLVCLLSAWILALAPWRTSTAWVLFAAFSLAAALTCIGAIVGALGATDLTKSFEDFRWQEPLGYPNTTSAFAVMAALPMLVAATRPDLAVRLKAPALGLATVLMAYALLPLSRGALLGIGLAGLALILFVPWRWSLVAHVAAIGLILVIVHGPILDVYDITAETGRAKPPLRDALRALGLAAVLGVAAGAVLGLVQQRIRPGERGHRALRLAGIAAWLAVAVGLGAVGIAHSESLKDAVNDQWDALQNPGGEYGGRTLYESSGTKGRLTSIDPQERYDYLRVAMDGFEANPIGGMGAGGFEHRYTIDHRYPKASRYPHNLVMKVLGDTGIIGAGLLLVLFGVLARGLLRGRSALAPPAIAVTAAAISVAAYFFAHGEFDWLETYPVLSGPALGFLIVALAVRHPAPPAAAATRARRLAVAATALAVGLAIVSLAVPYLAVRYQKRASGLARAQPALAFRDLDRAADVDPLAIDALMQRGALGLEQDELVIARNSFERANDREETWLAYYGLGLVAAARGDRVAAFGHFAKARTLNRNSPNVGQTTAVILHTGDIDPAVLFQTVQDTGLFQAEKIK